MSNQLIPRTKEEFLDQLPTRVEVIGDWTARTIKLDGSLIDPATSQALVNHSPDGFAWGYHGSGPAQLALAVLLHYTDGATAECYYQAFKAEFVAKLPQENFAAAFNFREIMSTALTS